VAALRATQPGASTGPVFYAPVGGMGAIVDALVAAVTAAHVDLRLDAPVEDVGTLDADGIVVATPAYRATQLLRTAAPKAAELLDDIEYASVVLVMLAFGNEARTRPLDASGFLVPRTEGLLMSATSWSSSKWAHLDDSASTIVRVSTGRLGDERAMGLDDDALIAALLPEIEATSGLRGEPFEVAVHRWPQSFPQYAPGHLDRVDDIERALAAAAPHVALAGAALRGLGVPACIRQGREAAGALVPR
jgi:oxygen-dependent protoporphyrinogen oxidase